MRRASLRTPWVGPFVLLLALAAVTPRPAAAATPAAGPALTAHTSSGGACIEEGIGYALAVGEYIDAWAEYTVAVEQGNSQTILAAATAVDRAAAAVASTGLLLVVCLIQLL